MFGLYVLFWGTKLSYFGCVLCSKIFIQFLMLQQVALKLKGSEILLVGFPN